MQITIFIYVKHYWDIFKCNNDFKKISRITTTNMMFSKSIERPIQFL